MKLENGNLNHLQQGDVVLERLENSNLSTKENEIILNCGCHKIDKEGNVFSCLKQTIKKGQQGIKTILTKDWRKLPMTITKHGYYQVTIHKKSWRVNRLLALNFIVNADKKRNTCVLHNDGNKLNNAVSNLRWGNQQDNTDDKFLHGTILRGSKNPTSKINESIALEIFNSTLSLLKTAKKYNVSKKLVLLIKQKKIWKHIHNIIDNKYYDNGYLVLAHGESTHKHKVEVKKAEMYEYYDDYLKENCLLLKILEDKTELKHEEHKSIFLDKGIYRVSKINEYDPFEKFTKKVID